MKKFIEVHNDNNERISVSFNHIINFYPDEDNRGSYLILVNNVSMHVTESYIYIATKAGVIRKREHQINDKKLARAKDRKIIYDIMHYRNNRIAFWLILLAIVLNIIMFLIIYKTTDCTPDVQLGMDLLLNVVFMLACLLAAGKTSKYSKFWGIGSIVLGGIQIGRIFWIPLYYYLKFVNAGQGLDSGLFSGCVVLLCLSAASLVVAGVFTLIRHKILQKYKPVVNEVEEVEEDG